MANTYWADRTAKAQAELTKRSIAQTEKQLARYYARTQQQVIAEFEATYNKLLTAVAEGRQPTPADLYKLDSYWQMQGQLKEALLKLGDKQTALLSERFVKQYQAIYEAIAIQGSGAFSKVDTEIAQQMINQIWCEDGQTWSNRVWQNTEQLQQTLNDRLIECVVAGKKPSDLKKLLQNDFDVSFSRADTLVRTEMSHIQNQAARERYKAEGVQEFEVWADKDERRCDVCGKLHQKRYRIDEKVPIPAHPNCRCCIIPVIESEVINSYSQITKEEKQLDSLATGSYNGVESSVNDNVKFETNKDVRKAVNSKQRVFVTPLTGKEKTLQEFFHNLFGANIAHTPALEGYYDIAAHGQSKLIEIFDTSVNSETLARIIVARKDYVKGTPIRLLSCFTGDDSSGTCIAKELAQMLGVEVIAPSFELVVGDHGQLYRYEGRERIPVNKEDFRRFVP